MRILVVTTMLPHADAPAAQPLVVHGQLSVIRSNHDVTVATFVRPSTEEQTAVQLLRDSGIQIEAVPWTPLSPARQMRSRARLASAWLRGKQPLRVLWFWDDRMKLLINRLLAGRKFDLLQVEDNAMANYFREKPQIPTLLTEHDVRAGGPAEFDISALPLGSLHTLLNQHWLRQTATAAEQKRFEYYQPSVWKKFDRIQVFTARDAAVISTMVPELSPRVRVNPFGIDTPTELSFAKEEPNQLVFVGTFLHPANVDGVFWLVKEILPILRTHRPIRLSIVGADPPSSVQALACEDVTVTGYVPSIEPYLERAAVVLAPIRIGGGMRRKVLQAMAFGKAVVTTRTGAEGLDFAGNRPPIKIADNVAQIVDEVIGLLSADDERHLLGQQARSFVMQHYTWADYARRLENIYAELVVSRRS